VLIGRGMIGYKFYQESKAEATAEDLEQAEEVLQQEIRYAETKIMSAEMNSIQENIEAAEAEIQLLTESEGKQALMERFVAVKKKVINEV
jgi:LPS O-antigen subunit length determinant protein (WzzB/FepE family)